MSIWLSRYTTLSRGLMAIMALSLLAAACAPAAAPSPAAPAPAAPKAPAQPAPAKAPEPAKVATPTPLPTPTVATTGKIQYGGTLTLALGSASGENTDPYSNSTTVNNIMATSYIQLIRAYRGNQYYDFQYAPALAESWSMPDDTSIVFKLRKGIKTAPVEPLNGREVTADDVVYSYQRFFLDAKSTSRGAFPVLKSVEAIDKYTVKFTSTKRSLLLLESSRQHPAYVIHKDVVDKFGDLKNQMLGAGPFYQASKQPGVGMFLLKNPNYFEADQIGPDKIEYLMLYDKAARMAAFRTGKLAELSGNSEDKEALVKTNPDIQVDKVFRGGGGSVFAMRADQKDKPWADPRVRKALSKAFDRDGFLAALYSGTGEWGGVVPCLLQPWALSCEELKQMDSLKFDPKEAKRLMTEAGYPNGFKTTICWATKGTTPSPSVPLIANMWKQNLNVTLDLEAEAQFYTAALDICWGGKYQGISSFGYGGQTNWYDFLLVMHSQGRYPSYGISDWDASIDDVMATLDVQQQAKKAKDLQRLILNPEKYGYNVLVPEGPTFFMAHPWVKNWKPIKATSGYHAYMWIDKGAQK